MSNRHISNINVVDTNISKPATLPQIATSYLDLKPGQLLLIKSPNNPSSQLLALAVHSMHVTQDALKRKWKDKDSEKRPIPAFVLSDRTYIWITLDDIFGIVTKSFAFDKYEWYRELNGLTEMNKHQYQEMKGFDNFCEISKTADSCGISFFEHWLRFNGFLDPDELFEDQDEFGEWLDPLMRCKGVDVNDDEFDILEHRQGEETKLLSREGMINTPLTDAKPIPRIRSPSNSKQNTVSPNHRLNYPNNPPPSYYVLKPGTFLVIRQDTKFPKICIVVHASNMDRKTLEKKMRGGRMLPRLPVIFLDSNDFGWVNLNEIIEWEVNESVLRDLIDRLVSRKLPNHVKSYTDSLRRFIESRDTGKSAVESILREKKLLMPNDRFTQYENCGLWFDVVMASDWNTILTGRRLDAIRIEQEFEVKDMGLDIGEIRTNQLKKPISPEKGQPIAGQSNPTCRVVLSDFDDNSRERWSLSNYNITTPDASRKTQENNFTVVEHRNLNPSTGIHTQQPLRTYQRPCQKLKPGTLTLIDPLTPAITLHPNHLNASQLNAKRLDPKILCVPLLKLTDSHTIVWKNPTDIEIITRMDIQRFNAADKSVPIWNKMIKLYSKVNRAGWSLLQQVLKEEVSISDHEVLEYRKIEDWLDLLEEYAAGKKIDPISKREKKWLEMRQEIERKILNAESTTSEEIEETEQYMWDEQNIADEENEDPSHPVESKRDTQVSKSATPGVGKRFPHRKPFAHYTDVSPGTLVVTRYFGKRPTPCFVVNCEDHLTHDVLKEKTKKKTLGPIPVLFLDDLTYTWAWLKDIMLLTKEECYESYDPNSIADDLMKGYKEAQSLFEDSEKTGQSIFEIFLRRLDFLDEDEEFQEYGDFGQWLNVLKLCSWFKPKPKQLAELREKQRQDVILLDDQDQDYVLEDERAEQVKKVAEQNSAAKNKKKRKITPTRNNKQTSKKPKTEIYPLGRQSLDAQQSPKGSTRGIDFFLNNNIGTVSKKIKKMAPPSEELIELNLKKARAELFFSMLNDSNSEPVPLSDYKSSFSALYKIYQYTTNGYLTIEHVAASKIHLIMKAIRHSKLREESGSDPEINHTCQELNGLCWFLLTNWKDKGWLTELMNRSSVDVKRDYVFK